MTNVFIVDGHELYRIGLNAILTDADITVVGEATTAAQARARVPAAKPDVVILDIQLQNSSGVLLCHDLIDKTPGIACLILGEGLDEKPMVAAFLAGAAGFVGKDIPAVDLVAAVRTVGAGRSLLDPKAMAALLHKLREPIRTPGPLAILEGRERQVLDLIGEGLTNRQIAERLYVAEKTVKNYVSRILTKLDGVTNRTQASIYLHEHEGPTE